MSRGLTPKVVDFEVLTDNQMGSAEESSNTPMDSERSHHREIVKGLIRALLIGAALWIVVPYIYPPLLDFIGSSPEDTEMPSVFTVQIIFAVYPVFSFLVDHFLIRYFGYQSMKGSDTADFSSVLESLPTNAVGELEADEKREVVQDDELTNEYSGEKLNHIHPAWTVTSVSQEKVYADTPRRCAKTGKELPIGDEHLILQATYNPPQFDPEHVWFRFKDEKALDEWMSADES